MRLRKDSEEKWRSRVWYFFVVSAPVLTKECVQCWWQLGASHTDAVSIAFAAVCLFSKIGDVRQPEALLRQAHSACKMAAQVWDTTVLRISMG